MARKLLVAVIGGNGMPDVAPSAFRLGQVLSNQAILLTGGAPGDGPEENVKAAVMAGSSNGLISVLPEGSPSCKLQGRRLILQTGLKGRYGRNPIVGSAADIVVVFPGGTGTLVELAYAAFQSRSIVFQSSIQQLRGKCSLEAEGLKDGLEEAKEAYPLISAKEADLENALARCLASPKATCVDTPEETAGRIFRLFDPAVALQADTNFIGLPGDEQEHWKQEFNNKVAELSKL
jgi:hypothetical protein